MPLTCSVCKSPTEIPDDAKFCPSCGAKIQAAAPAVVRAPAPDIAPAAPVAAPVPFAAPKLAPVAALNNNATQIDAPRAFAGRFLANGPTHDIAVGTVIPAMDLQNGTPVRLVLVSDAALPSPALAERALREWKQLAKVGTTKILKVIDQGRLDDGKVYVASEPPRGRTLAEVVASDGPLAVERIKRIVAQVGEALTEAQKVGVIHRDVSPQHVYLAGDSDDVSVGEFGLAEAVTESVFGSPAYLSPEQAEGKPVDQRSNIYSLGAVVYFMLTGKAPFEGDAHSLLAQHVASTPAAPSTRRAGLSPELDRIVMKALEKGGGRRHLTLRQFITEVDAVPLGSSVVRSEELANAKTLNPPEPESGNAATVMAMSAPSAEMLAAARAQHAPPVAEASVVVAQVTPAPVAPAPIAVTPALVVTAKPGAVQAKKPAAGGFRETAWFKKGEIEEELAKVQAAAATEDPLAPAGTTGTHGVVDEASIDLTQQDSKRLSLKTGATQMMTAIKVGTDGNQALPGDRMNEEEMIAEIDQSKRWFTVAGAIVLVAVIAVIIALVLGKRGDSRTEKPAPKAAATSPPSSAPTAAGSEAAKPGADPNAEANGKSGTEATGEAREAAASKPAEPSALAEAAAALRKGNYAAAVTALEQAAQAGAPADKVAATARSAQKALLTLASKSKKKKDHAGEVTAKTLLDKLKPFVPAAPAGKGGVAAGRRKR